MTKRIGGTRRKTRHKMAKNVRERGKVSLVRYFQKFKNGERVYLVPEPSVHSGLYHSRFCGKAGIVLGKRGECYEVKINDINKGKVIITHPVHLKRAD